MERITLNLIPKGITPICHASQYDTGRQIALDLMDDLQGYTLSDETIELGVCKPDGNIVTAAVEVTSGKTYVIIETTEQMTACEGDSECELKISKAGTEIGTLNFKLRVERDPLKDGIESDTEIHNLSHQISELVSEQYDSENVIFDSEPTSDHGNGYTVTSEGIKTYGDGIIALIPVKLNDLSDVNINNPQANQALIFDLTDPDNPVVTNGTVSTVGDLDDLNDVDTTGKQEGDSLRYNGVEWVAKPTTVKMTQAEYDAIVDFTPYANTHIVITDAPNLNATASDIEYSSGVSVADKLDEIPTLNDFIKVTSQSGTTTGGGVLSKTFTHKVVVLSAWSSIDNCIVDIYKDGVDFDNTGSLVWNFYCHNATGQSWGNTNLTIRMTYIDYNA